MRRNRSTPTSRSERRRGFSLVELLVAVGVVGVTLASVVKFFAVQARVEKGHTYRIEAQQGVRASLDAIARDVRLAGACLPSVGQFIALDGADLPAGDRITVRTGQVRNNTSCIRTTTTGNAAAGASVLIVSNATGYGTGMLVYVKNNNGSGEISSVTASSGDATGGTVTLGSGLTQAYPSGSGVYALDERVYQLDKSNPANPLLTLTINRSAPQAFAAGVSDLQFRYTLSQNCPPCDTVDLPPDTATWRIVNDVMVTASVKTVGTVRAEDQKTLVESTRAKPRNLLP